MRAGRLAAFQVDRDDATAEVASYHGLSVGGKVDAVQPFADALGLAQVLAGQGVHLHRSVSTGGRNATLAVDAERGDRATVSTRIAAGLTVAHLPSAQRAVGAGADEGASIWAEAHAVDCAGVALQGVHVATGVGEEYGGATIATRAGQVSAVGAERQVQHPVAVGLGDPVDALARSVEHVDPLAWPAEGNSVSVR